MLTLCETVLTCIGLADSVISVCVCYKKGGRSDMKVAVALLWAPIWAPSFPTSTHWKYLDERFVVGVSLAMFEFVNYFCSVLCADMTIQLIFLTVIHLSKIFFESMNSMTTFGRLSLLLTIIHLIVFPVFSFFNNSLKPQLSLAFFIIISTSVDPHIGACFLGGQA